jgi:hypothetical protein
MQITTFTTSIWINKCIENNEQKIYQGAILEASRENEK